MCGAPRGRKTGDPMIGEIIGDRYLLRDRLGQGASGTIYLAEHITLHRKVAVKILHHELSRDDLALERFRREATMVGEIDNEHIVEVFDFGRTPDGRMFLVMERLGGETLAAAIKRHLQLPIPQVVDVLTQIGEALMEAHAMGYIHRDLRPGNVFLAHRHGRDGFVKILDFGLAKLVEKDGEAPSTNLGMTFGDPCYMSPEQARGEPIDRRADIYALGVMAYEMLIGAPPFVGKRVFDVLTQHLETQPVPPSKKRPEIPLWLDAVILRCLAKRPDDRFITVYRLVEAIRAGDATGHIMTDEAARSMPSVPPPAPAPRPKEPEPPPPSAATPPPRGGNGANAEHPSGVWYDEGDAIRASQPLPRMGAEDSMLEYAPPTRRRWLVWALGIVGAGVLAGLVLLMLGGRDEKVAAPPEAAPPLAAAVAVAPPDAAPRQVAVAEPAPAPKPEEPPPAPAEPAPAPKPEAVPKLEEPPARPVEPAAKHEPVAKPEPARREPRPERRTAAVEPQRPHRPAGEPPAPPVIDFRPRPNPPVAHAEPLPEDTSPAATEAEFYVKLGHRALRAGDFEGAKSAFNKAREYEVASAAAIAGLGEVAMGQGNYDEATVHLEAASRLAPRSVRIHVLRGRAYLGAGRRQDAAAAFKKALSINPGDAGAIQGYQEATGG
ncbi:MAG TPA: protein kinase [Haliangiales bacterium]|nr:protein kinase [Haliangiales bacterium]